MVYGLNDIKGVRLILTAHSGSDQTEENSLAFVKLFVEKSCDAVEVDVRRSTDGVLYLSHDWTPHVEEAWTLETVFQHVQHTSVKVNADLKEENLERSVFDLAEKYEVKNQVILSGTVSLANLTQEEIENQLFYNIELCLPYLYRQEDPNCTEEDVGKLIGFCKENGISVVNMHYAFAQPRFIEALHRNGIRLSVWTVDDVEKINAFFDQGVYNVTSKQVLCYRQGERKGGVR